jgi:serine/threonine protein kinase
VRWASIEVLTEDKYSRASDVWAFGVLVYEVMSRGALPYNECDTVLDVQIKIKHGYTLSCPEECAPEVYARVMQPCWKSEPSFRPRFGELRDALAQVGAVPTHRFSNELEADVTHGNFVSESTGIKEDQTLLGPSVDHVHTVLAPKVVATVRPPWKDHRGDVVDPPESATIKHCVDAVVKPAGADILCPRDGRLGCAYVDALRASEGDSAQSVGRANALLSCESSRFIDQLIRLILLITTFSHAIESHWSQCLTIQVLAC